MYFCLLQVMAFSVASPQLGESRTINVYTPPAYATSPAALPVLYMLDGGMAEDFSHVATTLDSLIGLNRVRPVILVGIENTERRRDLTGPTSMAKDSTIARQVGGSAAFRSFIRDALMPEVRRRYRTTNESAIVGESLAGLFVVETLLLEPTLFRGYIALSPSLWWNGGALVRSAPELTDALAGLDRVVFLASANEEQIVDPTARLAAILMGRGQGGVRLFYQPRPDLAHDTIFRALAPEAFIDILGEGASGHD